MKKKELGKKWQSDYKAMLYTGNKSATPILIDLLKDRRPLYEGVYREGPWVLRGSKSPGGVKKVADADPNPKGEVKGQNSL